MTAQGVDPADLIFFGRLTPERFFAEAQRLGVTDEQLTDPAVYQNVFQTCLVAVRAETVRDLAASLDLPLSTDEAEHIARHSLVVETDSQPVPLSAAEAVVAEELYFHAVQAAARRHNVALTERQARSEARRMLRTGQRGLGWIQRLLRSLGCGVVLAAVVTLAAMAGAAVAASLR